MNNSTISTKRPNDGGEQQKIARNANRVTLGSLVGLLTGLVSQMVIAAFFGAGPENDAFLTALTVPVYLQSVLLAGLSFVFIPTFVKEIEQGREDDAWALVGAYFWLIGLTLLPLAVGVAFFAPAIIGWVAPGFSGAKGDMAAQMLAILIFAVPLAGYSVFTTGIENARDRFFWPAARSALGSIGNVILLILLYPWVGGMALAWGYLVAMAIETTITLVPVLRHGWPRVEAFTSQRVLDTGKLMAPLLLFGLISRITPLFERYFASGLPDGDLSYLGYADKLATMFERLLGVTVVTAIFPIMARAYTTDGWPGLRRQLAYGMRLTLAIVLPVIAIVAALAQPLTALLYERGAFLPATTLQVAHIVLPAMIGFGAFGMIGRLLARAFYVTHDTRTTSVGAVAAVFAYLPIAYLGVQWGGYVGLAWAETIYALFYIALLAGLLLIKFRFFPLRGLFYYLGATGLPALAAYGVAWLVVGWLATLPLFIRLLCSGGMAAIVYWVLLARFDPAIGQAVLTVGGVQKMLGLRPARLVAQVRMGLFQVGGACHRNWER